MVTKSKSRGYLRDYDEKTLKLLQGRYDPHLKPPRDGFLNKKAKERLLRLKKWTLDTSDRDIIDFFYEVRQRADSAIRDMQLLCEMLSEDQLEKIFVTREKIQYNDTSSADLIQYPITQLMESLLPHPIFAKKQTKEFMEKYMKARQWRKNILEDLVIEALTWYFNSGLMKTSAQKQMMFDAIDAIEVNSSSKKTHELDYNLRGEMAIIKC